MEKELEQIYVFEEIQWLKRGGEKWILQGDANTRYFHSKASGRKKRSVLFSLWRMGIKSSLKKKS
jgi:hypothetical protein